MTTRDRHASCEAVRSLLLDAVEGALGADDRRAVSAHVDRCPRCAADLDALTQGWVALPVARPAVPSIETRHRVLARASRLPPAPGATPRAGWPATRRWVGAAALVALAVAGVRLSDRTGAGEAPESGLPAGPAGAPAQLAAGDPIPPFTARDVYTGELRSLDELRGSVVLLNLWATWCLPCESEMPSMERVHRELGPRGLRIVALSIDRESTHLVRRWVEERGITFTVLHDSDGAFERAFASAGVPETYVFDRDGTLVTHEIGPRRWDAPESTQRLAALLAGGA